MCTCTFDVFGGGGKLHALLLYYLDTPPVLNCQFSVWNSIVVTGYFLLWLLWAHGFLTH